MKLGVSVSLISVFLTGFLLPISPVFAQSKDETPLPTIWLSQVISASELPVQSQTKIVANEGEGRPNIELTPGNFDPNMSIDKSRYWMANRLARSIENIENNLSFEAPTRSEVIRNAVEEIYIIYGEPHRKNVHEKIWNISNPNWRTGEAKVVTLKLIEMANGQTRIAANAKPIA